MKTTKKSTKTGPSAATTLILAILFLMVAGYVVYQIFGNLNSPYETTTAYTYQADDETTVSGYVVREESVLPNQDSGVLDITRAEGERVAAGQSIATVYTSSDAMEIEDQLDTLSAQLEQLNYALDASSNTSAGAKLDSSIQSEILSLRKNIARRQYTALSQDISELQALVIKRDYSAAGTSAEELTAQIQAIQTQINTLEAQQSRSAKRITAPSSGLFSAVTDGYEAVLTPAALETMTPSQLAGVTADSAVSSNMGKMVYGDTWYFAAVMDEETAAAYKEGHTVTLRFVKELNRELTMTIDRVSDSEGGQKLIVFSCNKYLPEVTLLRHQTASIIHESYSGLRVPTEALRVEDGVTGVYCLVGRQASFKPVDVVYQGNGYYLVEPSKKSDDTENTSSTRLRIGDTILITAEELYDGKVIE